MGYTPPPPQEQEIGKTTHVPLLILYISVLAKQHTRKHHSILNTDCCLTQLRTNYISRIAVQIIRKITNLYGANLEKKHWLIILILFVEMSNMIGKDLNRTIGRLGIQSQIILLLKVRLSGCAGEIDQLENLHFCHSP